MAGDAGERTFGGVHAGIVKIIRLIITSPVHLVRDGLAATLRGRAGLIVVDVTDLSPRGIAKIADAQPDIVLVDLGQTDPAATARAIKAVCLARLQREFNPQAPLPALSSREILALVEQGCFNKEIAR